jgi:putative endonuclease
MAEDLVERTLAAAGWKIIGRRVRVGRGELDLVAIDPGPPRCTVVVEVRWRSRRDFGLPEETLDARKRRALRRSIGSLRLAGMAPAGPVRFDLVAVEPPTAPGLAPVIRHHRGVAP